MPLVNEGVIINFSPVFKRLEDGVYLGSGLLKNILKYFRWSILYGNETRFVLEIIHLKNCF